MSRFTKHFAISPSPNKWGWWINDRELDYGIDSKVGGRRIVVPKGYEFDGKSSPTLLFAIAGIIGVLMSNPYIAILGILSLAIFKKIEADSISSACIHDYIFTDLREIGRVKADTIYLESLCHRNIPRLVREKKYALAYMMIIKYSMETIVLLIASRFVWYGLDKKIGRFIGL